MRRRHFILLWLPWAVLLACSSPGSDQQPGTAPKPRHRARVPEIRVGDEVADARLARDVLTRLYHEPLLAETDLSVTAREGAVTLEGAVDAEEQRQLANRVARGVPGVRSLRNDVGIAAGGAEQRDLELEERIAERLDADPGFPPQDIVSVSVHDREATLKGVVQTWTEHRLASRLAFLEGAREITNQLRVRDSPDLSRRSYHYTDPAQLGEPPRATG